MPKRVALFVPCYVDQFYPQVARATLELLERLGWAVDFPADQTCCGQPMANAGYEYRATDTYRQFASAFADYDYVVGPTGSCVYHVKQHYDQLEQTSAVVKVRENMYELCEFLHRVAQPGQLTAAFPHRVGLHLSCHGLRGLRLGTSSELNIPDRSSLMRDLLERVQGLELVALDRADECCGFGGTFAITEEAVSVKMGKDRLRDHLSQQVEVLTGGDMSCLMHLEGIARYQKSPLKVMHIAQILNGEQI